MEKLNDTLAMTSRRMERTLEITSMPISAFAIGKAGSNSVTIGGDVVASAAAQQDTTAADAPARVQMRRVVTVV